MAKTECVTLFPEIEMVTRKLRNEQSVTLIREELPKGVSGLVGKAEQVVTQGVLRGD